ncbi:unnamed protein product [Polarella glacialis]|uniref:Rhodanese domain-containing protein n=1 Tax=Polarella glacialis TaxID=89957 RepID=A0A813JHW2_POLGL|nr:unnamed protein product [Polarella glacialis]
MHLQRKFSAASKGQHKVWIEETFCPVRKAALQSFSCFQKCSARANSGPGIDVSQMCLHWRLWQLEVGTVLAWTGSGVARKCDRFEKSGNLVLNQTQNLGIAFGKKYVSQHEAVRKLQRLWDVRGPEEFATGHVPKARNVPFEKLQQAAADRLAAAGSGRLFLICAFGTRSAQAQVRLSQVHGLQGVFNVRGGLASWEALGGLVVAS